MHSPLSAWHTCRPHRFSPLPLASSRFQAAATLIMLSSGCNANAKASEMCCNANAKGPSEICCNAMPKPVRSVAAMPTPKPVRSVEMPCQRSWPLLRGARECTGWRWSLWGSLRLRHFLHDSISILEDSLCALLAVEPNVRPTLFLTRATTKRDREGPRKPFPPPGRKKPERARLPSPARPPPPKTNPPRLPTPEPLSRRGNF